MIRVIAIDPGEMTGYAYGVIDGTKLTIQKHDAMNWVQFCHQLFMMQQSKHRFDVIVYEG